MDQDTQTTRDHGFVIGLVTGTFVGAGLMMWFAPRTTSELCERITDSAKSFGRRASARAEGVVDELARKGRNVRNDAADAVARGAHEVGRYATAAKRSPAVPPSE